MELTAKIFVAGHEGMVGSALCRALQLQGYLNIIFRTFAELDLRNQADVDHFFSCEKPDYVFCAAAKVGGIGANNTYKAEFIYDNIMIATNLIHTAKKYGIKKLLNLGSSCIYPKNCAQPMTEYLLLTGLLEPTNEPYAVAKIAAIKLCRYYNEQYGTNFISVMPTNMYGTNDNYNLETSHAIAGMIRKFRLAQLLAEGNDDGLWADIACYPIGYGISIQSSLEEIKKYLAHIGITAQRVTLWGTGTPYREFMYVDDLAAAVVFLMQKYDYNNLGEFINIGTGSDMTVAQAAFVIKNIIGYTGDIFWDTSKPDGTPRKCLDVSRINVLGWRATMSFKEGIQHTYEAYLKKIEIENFNASNQKRRTSVSL